MEFLSQLYQVLGRAFQILLFGFLAAQISRYHDNFPNDRLMLRVVARTSFLLSFLLASMVLYELAADALAENNGRRGIPNGTGSGIAPMMIILLNGFAMSVSQVFFSSRIRQISHKKWLQILICVLSALQLGGSIGHALWSNFTTIPISDAFSSAWMASNIACDLLITLSMIWFLRQAKGGATFRPTKTMLAKVLAFTLETGLITTLWMVSQLILQTSLLQSRNHVDAYLLFFYASGTLYSVWLLATLNARSSFNKDLPSFVDADSLPTAPGELHFKHPTAEGTEIVISITNNGVTSRGGALEVE
ncbi:hypothetical protein CCMSSC00406_0007073 [Pleurotus cornucopiae]|uniref:Uncharacterized protein n=1 Tax=Pleurotus cornucopiae TaxID=5321 RepID=A0ACB7J452_PLECO|nr:hypothetical protein CCMSSC00406_0007073 [Pleurotus cornucopiae]